MLKDIIDTYYPSFTKSEKKIGDFVKDNWEEIIYFSIAELSEKIGIGEATIHRFCKKMGFKGYYDFKIDIAKYGSEVITIDKPENYIENIEKNMIEAITSTKALLDKVELNKAIKLIRDANKIFFYGVGSSGITSLEGEARFFRIGYHTKAIIDPHFQAIVSSTLTERDLIIAISLSGNTKDIIDSVKVAYDNKVKIVAITNYIKSSISELSDVVLLTAGREKPLEGGSLVAKISQLYILDLLCTGISMEEYDRIAEVKERTTRAIINKF